MDVVSDQKPLQTNIMDKVATTQDMEERYPILKNEGLVKKFLDITMTNNQKGRIRQLLKDNLKGTSESLLPDVIHDRIQAILKSSQILNETDLRKLRILYNMLRTAIKTPDVKKTEGPVKKKKKKAKEKKEKANEKEDKGEKVDKENQGQKVKGPKRYVVFIGNLPLGIDKEKIMQHFSMLSKHIKDVRIPKQEENKKSAIAYLELANEPSYEMALSKHHSMLQNKRINVLYTTQQKTKVSKTEAKGKSAKLIAMQKSGKLIGSIPINRKRSARRKKMKAAQKKLAQESS
ncbi:hypothetical protein MSG28_015067 [Choristoneura fumiferana]|uniref:Uncharacterized protein n=1 Tax=Choristoneura fumiferana TaxID=7141 RepID=A0ACC0KYQ4_CHOFU|nr:hypothetical protein MSG28_015067 [Choristoneura fumiferana]